MYASRKDHPFVTIYDSWKKRDSPLSILTFPAIMFMLEDMEVSNNERLCMLIRAFDWVKCFGYPTCEDVYGMSKSEATSFIRARNNLMNQIEAAHMFGQFFASNPKE